jgi:RND family efflux transporter MFP subunit
VITRRDAEVGMLVTAGQEPLFVIEDMSRVRVQVKIPQTYAGQTRVGSAATVGLPESPARSETAAITRTANAVDVTSRTMLAEIDLQNSDNRWQPGSYAQVRLATAAADSSWTIPTSTLQMRVDGPHVAVVDPASQIEMRAVKLGRDMGNRIIVTEGITGSERLVVNPSSDLASGANVKIRDAENQLAQR